jgi:hypothetical protein
MPEYLGCVGGLVAWATELAGEKLAGVLPQWWAHVQGVVRRVQVAVALFSFDDGGLLISAAQLHDIGYAPDLAGTGFNRSTVPGTSAALAVLIAW